MKKRILVAILLSVIVAVSYDDNKTYATEAMYGYVDIPTSGQTIARGAFYVAGWAFECSTGNAPVSMSIGLFNPSIGWWIPNITRYTGIHRPDVSAAYSGACPNVTDYSGYHIYPSAWPPPGQWTLHVNWTDGVTSYNQNMPVTITEF
ncbi:MAG TPA: hypothetical protein VFT47_00545 [Vicinamibacterales bacterium]|nr:hypothetical protein [Vicinamibacterales bacterium]